MQIALAPADEPTPVVLDLMCPLRPGRYRVGHGRQTWFDKAIGVANGSGRAPEHGGLDTPAVGNFANRSRVYVAPTPQEQTQ
jgi:hypothetical protein